MLGNAFRMRLDSDYEISGLPNDVLARGVLEDAEQFVERATVYLQQDGHL